MSEGDLGPRTRRAWRAVSGHATSLDRLRCLIGDHYWKSLGWTPPFRRCAFCGKEPW